MARELYRNEPPIHLGCTDWQGAVGAHLTDSALALLRLTADLISALEVSESLRFIDPTLDSEPAPRVEGYDLTSTDRQYCVVELGYTLARTRLVV